MLKMSLAVLDVQRSSLFAVPYKHQQTLFPSFTATSSQVGPMQLQILTNLNNWPLPLGHQSFEGQDLGLGIFFFPLVLSPSPLHHILGVRVDKCTGPLLTHHSHTPVAGAGE